MIEEKICSTCKENKPLDKFYKNKSTNDGFANVCISCQKEYQKKHTLKRKLKTSLRRNYEEFRDKLNQSKFCSKCDEYKSFDDFWKDENCKYGLRPDCKECKQKSHQNFLDRNPDYWVNYYDEHKEEMKRKTSEWTKNNPEKWKKYKKQRYENNINYKIKCCLRSAIKRGLDGKRSEESNIKLLGCTIDKFKTYIKKQFEDGMSWDNHGEWHIDHIKPIASFDLEDKEQRKECFHYTNCQPLWAKDNLSKNSRYE